MGAPEGTPSNGSVPAPPQKPGDEGDSDWEYEYDETETEDLYFTLDLPPLKGNARKRRKVIPPATAVDGPLDALLGTTRSQQTTSRDTGQQTQDHEPISFTDLHTSTPLVEYGDRRYDCQWSTDLGTQFLVSRPGITKDPRRAGHTVDVVALSRVRLKGRPATKSVQPVQSTTAGASAGEAIVLEDEDDQGEDREEFFDQAGSEAQGQMQSSFIERVAEIQRRKASAVANGSKALQSERTSLTPSAAAMSNDPQAALRSLSPPEDARIRDTQAPDGLDDSAHPSQAEQPNSVEDAPTAQLGAGSAQDERAQSESVQPG